MRGPAAISNAFPESLSAVRPTRNFAAYPRRTAVAMLATERTKCKNDSRKTFRLESGSTECFQADTDNSNRTRFRLERANCAGRRWWIWP